jgi:bacillithiol system protein YtxJ
MSDPFRPLTSDAEWEAALDASEDAPVLIFKHSSACPVSAQAHEEMADLADADEVPIYKVVVQSHRAASNAIEDDLGVRHETPQAILLDDREAVFDTSHFDVTADTMRQTLQRPSVSSS